MIDLSDRPILGPYALMRELTPYAAFADGLEVRPDQEPGRTLEQPRDAHHGHGSPVVRSAANIWRAMMGIGAGGPQEQSVVTSKNPLRPGVPKSLAGMIAPARFLAMHLADQSSHVAYRFPAVPGEADRESFRSAVARASLLTQPHILKIERFMFDPAGHPWLVTPYTGDVDGLRTLGRLLRDKNGQMPPMEAERALMQLFEAAHVAHTPSSLAGTSLDATLPLSHHGILTLEQVLVDRHGSLAIELYGLARALRTREAAAQPFTPEVARDEIRSIVEIGYQLVTGLRAEAPWIPAGRLVRNLDPRWDRWFEHGLDPSRGFDTAQQAISELPSRAAPLEPSKPRVTVRGVWSRLRQ